MLTFLNTAIMIALLEMGYKALAMVILQTLFNFATLIINSYYLIDNKRCKGIKLNANCYFYGQCERSLVA